LKILHDFTDNVIKARRQELVNSTNAEMSSQDDDDIGSKRKLALLDVLLQSTINGNPLTDLEIREEVDTFVFEGHDTTTSGIAFCLFNLAKNPKIQQKCFDEICDVIGDDLEKSVTLKDLTELKYLELVIKESLRLYPSVPFFGRKLREDLELGETFAFMIFTCFKFK
jgi:cytochrome P450 family 4